MDHPGIEQFYFENQPIIIFGAGMWGNYAWTFLKRYDFELIGFMDNNPSKFGMLHLGVKVYSTDEIGILPKDVCFLIAMQYHSEEVKEQLLSKGVKPEKIFIYSYELESVFYKRKYGEFPKLPEFKIPTIDEDYCTGCGACVSVCPANAVKLQMDDYGYYKCHIEDGKCIHCGKCDTVCSARNNYESNNRTDPDLYAFYTSDEKLLEASSSGGAFTLLAEAVLESGGAVAAAVWKEDFTVEHAIAYDKSELERMRKSKYLQSYMGNIGTQIKRLLGEGREVLFVGCPCQVAGMKSLFSKESEKLYLADLLCGNAPSTMFFRKYLEEKFTDRIETYQFRYKEKNWNATTVKALMKDGKTNIYHGSTEDAYQRVYHDHTMCPVHCEHCKYQALPRYGDITIGDFWGLSGKNAHLTNMLGTSAVLVNNEKGERLIGRIPDAEIGQMTKVPLDWLGGNGFALEGTTNFASKYRDRFYQGIKYMDFTKAIDYAFFGGDCGYDAYGQNL